MHPNNAFLLSILHLTSGGNRSLSDFNTPSAQTCFDEVPDCSRRVLRGECKGMNGTGHDVTVAVKTLLACRPSCRASLLKEQEEGRLSESHTAMVNLAGGVGNLVLDPLGHLHEICSLNRGFDGRARGNFLRAMVLAVISLGNITGYTHPRQYTEKGIMKSKLPKGVFGDILRFRQDAMRESGWLREPCEPGTHFPCLLPVENAEECTYVNQTGSEVLKLTRDLASDVYEVLRPEAEKWAGVPLVNSAIYGIRRYKRGAQLFAHVDHLGEYPEECTYLNQTGSEVLKLTRDLASDVYEVLRPEAEKWAGVPLVNSAIYGIRRYKRGAQLFAHVDHLGEFLLGLEVLKLTRDLASDVYEALRPEAEKWAGVPLVNSAIYGIRRYKRGAQLFAHVDHLGEFLLGLEVLKLTRDLASDVYEALRPEAEKWAGVPLVNSAIYGIRRYKRGAQLFAHVDHLGEYPEECTYLNQTGSEVLKLTRDLASDVYEVLRPEAEKWAGVPLVNSAIYGIRRYKRGAQLFAHVDHLGEYPEECTYLNQTGSEVLKLTRDLASDVYEVLRPEAEKWAGVPLVNSAIYGIRRYKRGAQLFAHVDHLGEFLLGLEVLKLTRDLASDVYEALRPEAEKWAGVPLVNSAIYGIRRYKRGAQLFAHVDHLGEFLLGLEVLKLTRDLASDVYEALRPEAEKWAGVPLVNSAIYGIRRYKRGAQLFAHVDHLGEYPEECTYLNQTGSEVLKLTRDLASDVYEALRPEAEKWAGVPLVNSAIYGIRRYKRGAQLFAHVDHLGTHVISAIINIAQKVDQPWPLEIYDFQLNVNKVLLQPGEVLWYESAKLPHGRPTPFEGEYFDNIFVHFRPKGE